MSTQDYINNSRTRNSPQAPPHFEIMNGELLLPISWPEFFAWGKYIKEAQRVLGRAVLLCSLCGSKQRAWRNGVYLHAGELPLLSIWCLCGRCAVLRDADKQIARVCRDGLNNIGPDVVVDSHGELHPAPTERVQ